MVRQLISLLDRFAVRQLIEARSRCFSPEPEVFRVASVTDLSQAARHRCRSIFSLRLTAVRLHVREYGRAAASTLSVVCLPGLTRTTEDFDALAAGLALGEQQRRVIAIDSRGRGDSEYDANPKKYTLAVELAY
jgi:hypothetical protein